MVWGSHQIKYLTEDKTINPRQPGQPGRNLKQTSDAPTRCLKDRGLRSPTSRCHSRTIPPPEPLPFFPILPISTRTSLTVLTREAPERDNRTICIREEAKGSNSTEERRIDENRAGRFDRRLESRLQVKPGRRRRRDDYRGQEQIARSCRSKSLSEFKRESFLYITRHLEFVNGGERCSPGVS